MVFTMLYYNKPINNIIMSLLLINYYNIQENTKLQYQ